MANVEHKPGEKVPLSGIYRVVHDGKHAEAHEVTAIRGEHFPPCRGCGPGVRFTLSKAAKHLSEHEHMETKAHA